MENCGDRQGHVFFDTMEVDDDEWEAWKDTGEQLDNRIIEVVWDAQRQTWRRLRFRDDKLEGNYTTIVQKIIDSIKDGVEAEVVRPSCARYLLLIDDDDAFIADSKSRRDSAFLEAQG
jgi:mRNA guanylyltransferase